MNHKVRISEFRGQYWFLSSFSEHPVVYEDVWYPGLEYGFQAAKSLDPAVRAWIAQSSSPAEAKRRGRSVELRPSWDEYVRYMVMEELLASKFALGTAVAGLLRGTGAAVLVEGNRWHDNVWGDCVCGRQACRAPGMNLLGWMLMRQRKWTALGVDQ